MEIVKQGSLELLPDGNIRIKNLSKMIEWTKGLYRKRQETYDAEIYQSGLPENKGISDSTKGNKGGNPNPMNQLK